jgi:hypothetical protein
VRKNRIKKFTLILLIVLVGIQFIPTNYNQSDIVLQSGFNNVYAVPNNIKMLIQNSCYDCHSNNTNYPWYGKLQPVALLLDHHIKNGKAVLNFSEFGTYSKRRQTTKLESIADQIKNNEMPLSSYTFIHNDAKFSEKEKTEIIEWIDKVMQQN